LSGNGVSEAQVEIGDATLRQILEGYTREAGVRGLERAIGAVVRAKAVEWADLDKASATGGALKEGASEPASLPWSEYKRVVEPHEIEGILGVSMWDAAAERDLEPRRGVVYGLVVTGDGEGMILPVESLAVPGTGKLKLTGSLGEVLKESGALALSWVQRHAFALGITDSPTANALGSDVHVHLPAGAQKKDGPSAGVAMVCALVSLLKGVCVPTDVAMTGEITLRGRVTPVGGIKEKVLGAHRAHIKLVILPSANQREVEHDVPPEIRNSMQFVFVRTIEEALEAAFGKDVLAWRPEAPIMMESRL
jgi:ATP-dependent Lon protease